MASPSVVPVDAPVVEVDNRRRVSLSKTDHRFDRYFMTEHDDGTIILTPAVVITAFEARALQDPEVAARIATASPDSELVDVDLEELP